MWKDVERVIKERGMTIKSLADIADIPVQPLYDWKAGKSRPRIDRMKKIGSVLDIPIDFLLREEDEPNHTQDVMVEKITNNRQNESDKIPLFGRVAGGNAVYADSVPIGTFSLPSGDGYFAVMVKGDSMAPDISDGDVVLCRCQPDIENGDIAIVAIDGDEATCKQVKKNEKGIMLIGFNTSVYQPQFFTWEEVESIPITIKGKVVRCIKSF